MGSVLTLTSFPFRVVFANEMYSNMTNRTNLLGESFFDLFVQEDCGIRKSSRSSVSSMSSTSSTSASGACGLGPSISSCTKGPFGEATTNGREEIVKIRCHSESGVARKRRRNSSLDLNPDAQQDSVPESLHETTSMYCKIRVRPVYKFPIRKRAIDKNLHKQKVLQYYAVFLDKVELPPGSPDIVHLPMPLGGMQAYTVKLLGS